MRNLGWGILVTTLLLGCGPTASSSNGSTGTSSHTLTLHVAGSGGGTVRSSNPSFQCSGTCSQPVNAATPVQLVAIPDGSSSFSGWQGACSGKADCQLSMDSDREVTATFSTAAPPPPGTVRISAQLSGTGAGKMSSSAGIDCPGTCSVDVPVGTRLTFAATPDANSSFSGWGGACSGSGTCTVDAKVDATVWGNFEAKASDDCAGLLPSAVPAPIVPPLPADSGCGGGVADEGGTFGLPFVYGSGREIYPGEAFFQIQNGKAVRVGEELRGTGHGNAFYLLSQPGGFTLYSGDSSDHTLIDTYSHDGAFVSEAPISRGAVGRNYSWDLVGIAPSGGTAAARSYATSTSGDYVMTYQRFDQDGKAATNEVQIGTGAASVHAVAVTAAGNTLVVAYPMDPQKGLIGRWVSAKGSPLTDWFQVDSHVTGVDLEYLLGGGLLRRTINTYTEIWNDGSTTPTALPQWLASRASGWWLRTIHGGKGYAMGGTCAGIEVLATSGKSCGCVAVPGVSQTTGIGRDGSVIVSRGDSTCHYELYPGLFH